jgi:hypothetical protein
MFDQYGFGRWVVETLDAEFLGYAGIMPSRPAHPLGPHADIGCGGCGPLGGMVSPLKPQRRHCAMLSLAAG